MSVILTLGVSSAGTTQGREEEEPYSTEGRRTRSLPSPTHLSHTLNYFPAAYTVSPSFLSTPSGGFRGGHSRQYPSAPRAHPSSRPAQDPGLLPPPRAAHSCAAFTPTLPLARGNTQKHPPWWHVHPSRSQRQAQRRQESMPSNPPCLENPSPANPPHHSQTSPLAVPRGRPKRTVPKEKLLSDPKSCNFFHYFKTQKRS